jgi:hypothetical protein
MCLRVNVNGATERLRKSGQKYITCYKIVSTHRDGKVKSVLQRGFHWKSGWNRATTMAKIVQEDYLPTVQEGIHVYLSRTDAHHSWLRYATIFETQIVPVICLISDLVAVGGEYSKDENEATFQKVFIRPHHWQALNCTLRF